MNQFLVIFGWGLLAASAAVGNEWMVRHWPGHSFFWYYGRVGFWSQPIIALGIYRLMAASPSLVSGVVTFTLCTAMLRVFVQTLLLHEHVGMGNWIAFGLVIAGSLVKAFWRG